MSDKEEKRTWRTKDMDTLMDGFNRHSDRIKDLEELTSEQVMNVTREERRQRLWCDTFVAAIESDRDYDEINAANMAIEEFGKQFPEEAEPVLEGSE